MLSKVQSCFINFESQTYDLISSYLKDIDRIEIQNEFTDVVEAYNFLKNSSDKLVFVDITHKEALCLDIIKKITEQNNKIKMVVISSDTSSQTVIKAMRAGAVEFFAKPVIKNEFLESVTGFVNQINGIEEKKDRCKVITTFSNKGGIGKTTIAINMALELANITKEKVALVDLNLQLGDVSTFLDLAPGFNVAHIVNNLDNINSEFLLNSLEQYEDTSLYVLADPPYLEQAKDISAEQISKLFELLKQTFSYIVVDTSSSFDAKTIAALDNSDLILLVSIVNLPAVRNCQRCLDLFENLGYPREKCRVIVNRFMENDEIKIDDVQEAIGRKIYWKIPNNYFTIMSAINKGVPVSSINQDSNVANSYRELAVMLSDNIYKENFNKKILRNK